MNGRGTPLGSLLHQAYFCAFSNPEDCCTRKELLRFLLEKGADPNIKDDAGQDALYWTVTSGAEDSREIAELLIRYGAHVNARDKHGLTLLHWVALSGSSDIAALLIANGAGVNATDRVGQTPLDFAWKPLSHWTARMAERRKKTRELLLQHGAKSGKELE